MSLVSDTSTADYSRQLAGVLQDMLDNEKVTGIALLHLDWGPITVGADGASALVTTFETWHFDALSGSVDYVPARNDYTLVLDQGTWKIKSDVITSPA